MVLCVSTDQKIQAPFNFALFVSTSIVPVTNRFLAFAVICVQFKVVFLTCWLGFPLCCQSVAIYWQQSLSNLKPCFTRNSVILRHSLSFDLLVTSLDAQQHFHLFFSFSYDYWYQLFLCVWLQALEFLSSITLYNQHIVF